MDEASVALCYMEIEKESMISDSYFVGTAGIAQGERLTFSDIPIDVVMQKMASYTEEVIPGRSEPWVNYSHTQGTVINFTGRLIAQGEVTERNAMIDEAAGYLGFGLGLGARFSSRAAPFLGIAGNAASLIASQFKDSPDVLNAVFKEVHLKVAWIEALLHPQYDSQGRAFPPPIVWFHLGDNFHRRGILKNVNFAFHGPWEPTTLMAYYVDCNITFQELNLAPKGYVDVRQRWLSYPKPTKESLLETLRKDALSIARSSFGI